MTTGYDVGALVPERMCGSCGQPDPAHLPVCPELQAVQGVTPEVTAQVEQMEHNLGQAV